MTSKRNTMMKKAAAMLMVVMMLFTLVPGAAFAANDGTITIDNAVVGQEYTIYQVLDLESYNEKAGAYAYKATAAWKTFVESDKIANIYMATDAQGYVTWVGGDNAESAAAFAKLAQAHAATLNENQGTAEAENTTVTFSNLDLGYYLLDSTLGTLCSLDTTNPTVTIEEKNATPSVTKKVQEDSNSEWNEENTADINQEVNFKATVTVQAGAENYVLHDTMSAGLTYNSVTSVTVDGVAVDAANYTVTSTGLDDGCTFEVAFADAYVASLEAGTEIVVEYSATLNENAVVGAAGNKNTVKLEYGDVKDSSFTPEDSTTTYTHESDVFKYTLNDEGEKEALAGAIFKLSTDKDGNNIMKFDKVSDNHYRVNANGTVTEITTDETGTFNLKGLDAGTYYLTETQAPAGYNELAGPREVIISAEADKQVIEVENKTGAELPETGGIGTTIFYAVGGVLVVGAGILLITRKRMGA